MSETAPLDETANAAAEEILRIIYGDDLTGCAVRLDSVATVIREAVAREASDTAALRDLHEKGFEAIQLLATPPADGDALEADQLRSLLGDRLDQIQTLAKRILSTTRQAARE